MEGIGDGGRGGGLWVGGCGVGCFGGLVGIRQPLMFSGIPKQNTQVNLNVIIC